MSYILRTISYFLTWGTFYGMVLGAWSGTAIFPLFGTLYAVIWGTGVGAACGFLCGSLVAVLQGFTFHPDVDMVRYRRRLTLGIGYLFSYPYDNGPCRGAMHRAHAKSPTNHQGTIHRAPTNPRLSRIGE